MVVYIVVLGGMACVLFSHTLHWRRNQGGRGARAPVLNKGGIAPLQF